MAFRRLFSNCILRARERSSSSTSRELSLEECKDLDKMDGVQ